MSKSALIGGLFLMLSSPLLWPEKPPALVSPVSTRSAQPASGLEAFFSAYPEACASREKAPDGLLLLKLKTGQSFVFDDGKAKTTEERLENPDLQDMLQDPYPLELAKEPWTKDFDPGRYRHAGFFGALYGSTEEEVRQNLVKVDFLGSKVAFNGRHGAADALRRVGEDLQAVFQRNPAIAKYGKKLGGTFSWRKVLRSSRLSAHSFGIAIDLDPDLGGYWEWEKSADYSDMKRREAYPAEIVAAFERYGFIWGGKWWHFDLMHFEYRPELIQPQKGPMPAVVKSSEKPKIGVTNGAEVTSPGQAMIPPKSGRADLAKLVKEPASVVRRQLPRWWHFDFQRLRFHGGGQERGMPGAQAPGLMLFKALGEATAKTPGLADLVTEPIQVTKANPSAIPPNVKIRPKLEVKLPDLVQPLPGKTLK